MKILVMSVCVRARVCGVDMMIKFAPSTRCTSLEDAGMGEKRQKDRGMLIQNRQGPINEVKREGDYLRRVVVSQFACVFSASSSFFLSC